MDSFIKIFTYFAALHALVFPSGNAISNLVRCISGRSQQWLIKMGVVGGRSLFCCNLSMQINIFDGFQRSYYLWKVWTRRPLCLVLALNKQTTNSSDGTWLWLVFTCTQNKKKKTFWSGAERFWVAFMAENPNSRPVITTASSSYLECGNSSTRTPWYDKESMLSVPYYLILVEVVSKLYFVFIKTRLELY